jgi:diaminobutyrate-2-oxoglutarate transaminase
MTLTTFEKYESEARSYCRGFPVVFSKAKSSFLYDEDGEAYIDFLCGAGSLNYGHNNELAKKAVLEYIRDDNIMMSLDLHSTAKKAFIEAFQENILLPRGLHYKLQFTSPTGTSVVESSIKLARKVTGRQNIIAFTNAFHGMSGGSLSLTANKYHRQAVSYGSVTRLPYDGYLAGVDSVEFLRKLLEDNSSGVDLPAAVIVETIQGEGGLNVASVEWLRNLRELTREFGILLIVDDIQAGCGRSGRFFSFERADIEPDMVCLSKSIGGMGFPMAVLLLKREIDVWSPGEDNGTFRGNNLAFVAAAEVLHRYWNGRAFEEQLHEKEAIIRQALEVIARKYSADVVGIRGLGLMQGVEFRSEDDTAAIIRLCFEQQLVVECCGPRGEVLKIMPALTIEPDVLRKGLGIIEKAVGLQLDRIATSNDALPDAAGELEAGIAV